MGCKFDPKKSATIRTIIESGNSGYILTRVREELISPKVGISEIRFCIALLTLLGIQIEDPCKKSESIVPETSSQMEV